MFGLLKKKGALTRDKRFPGLAAYNKLGIINEGSRSVLYRVSEQGGEEYCLKLFKENAAETINKILRIGMKWEGDWSLQFDHPGVVDCHYAGRDGTQFYLLLEYLSGTSLLHCIYNDAQRLHERRVDCALAILQPLIYLHNMGVIHRDICPKNFMFAEDSTLRMIDFGIAISTHDRTLSRAGVTGTPSYMAPEIFKKYYNLQTDIFAFGVTMYELFTGAKPYRVSIGNLNSPMVRHFDNPVRPPSELNPNLNKEFDRVILKTMAVNPNERYESLLQVEQALIHIKQGLNKEI
ncbi:MAG: serine/threonine-protein kinase [Planctomycetota bacterium]|nr:serine/threonine-protein kinase [Planctomycetota bacterium]MDA1142822.1 serine/threonine-protein kinase [Planctomycetota bacterium]